MLRGMNSCMITAMELLPALGLVVFSVWAALARDEALAYRRRLMVWSAVWVALVAVSEVEFAMGPKDCKCCEPTLWESLVIYVCLYGMLAAVVALVGAAVYYPTRRVVQRRRQS